MTAIRSRGKRSLAFVTALAVVLALAIPFGTALASHSGTPTTSAHDLDAYNGSIAAPGGETASNPTGTPHTVTAEATDATGAGLCADDASTDICEIDWEFISGPAVTITSEGGTPVSRSSDDGDTPLSPDATCLIDEGGADNAEKDGDQCSIVFTASTPGTVLLRAFVDDDRNNATNTNVELDTTEGRNEATAPGDVSEVDDTDVIEKTFFSTLGANVVLDCTPERPVNPSTGADSSETFTCQLWNNNATPANQLDDTQNTTAGVKIDGENDNGANDPDNAGFATGGNVTADYNDIGTTDANGTATVTIPSSEGQAGDTLLCFWADTDSDTTYADAGTENDGANCNDGNDNTPITASPSRVGDGSSDRDDVTDVVQKRWRAIGSADSLTLTPASDQNLHGSTHTVTATVLDPFGNPVVGARVDIMVTAGHNFGGAGTTINDAFTNSSGQATLTYTDTNPDSTNGASDTIEACVDNDSTNTPPSTATCDDPVFLYDASSKFWFATLPTVDEVILDMQMDDSLPADLGGADTNECPDAGDGVFDANATAVNVVDTWHEVCAQVEDAANAGIPGQEVTFTVDAPAFFTDAFGTDYGQTFVVNADADGEAQAAIYSTAAGTFTVTATAGGKSDSGTKTYRGDVARRIDCLPATQSAEPGTQTVINCGVTDRFGNPSQDTNADGAVTVADVVRVAEVGPGFLVSAALPTVSAAGNVEIRVQTAESETGTQTVTAELEQDAPAGVSDGDLAADLDDPCDQAEGNLATEEGDDSDTDADGVVGIPAGDCEQSATVEWEEQPQPPQCDDSLDNDGDGRVDENDPGCHTDGDATNDASYDPTDDDETDVQEDREEARSITIRGHFKGQVQSDSAECQDGENVKLFRKKKGGKRLKGTTTTNSSGNWNIFIKRKKAAGKRWFARVTKSSFENETGGTTTCLKDDSPIIKKKRRK